MGERVLGAILIAMISCSSCARPRQGNVSPVTQASGTDLNLLRRLLQHGDAAVRILELCRSKAGRAELKQACTTGLDSVQKRNAQLQAWERTWPGQQSNPSVSHDDQYKTLFDQMRAGKGDEFDEAAARAIRVHAREGLSESTICQEQAMHPELKQFCLDLNSAQQRALENARQWICQWFKDCSEAK